MGDVAVPSTSVLSTEIRPWKKQKQNFEQTRCSVSFVLALAIADYGSAYAQQITRFEFGVGAYGKTATKDVGTRKLPRMDMWDHSPASL